MMAAPEPPPWQEEPRRVPTHEADDCEEDDTSTGKLKVLLSTITVYLPGGTRLSVLGSSWFHVPVPETVAPGASWAKPKAGS